MFFRRKKGLLYDICFLDNKIILNYDILDLKEINTFENDSRTRIVLINSPSIFKINYLGVNLNLYLPIDLYELNYNSFKIAFFDFFQKAYSVKAISQEEEDSELLIVNILKENKIILINFFKN